MNLFDAITVAKEELVATGVIESRDILGRNPVMVPNGQGEAERSKKVAAAYNKLSDFHAKSAHLG